MLSECDVMESAFKPSFFGEDWMALSAGTEAGFNSMTVAWGQTGTLWDRYDTRRHAVFPVAVVYVRPQRHTKLFMDKEEFFTLSYLGKEHRKELSYLGTHSGREGDKIKAAGLTPVFGYGTVYFEEAELVLVCRKLYSSVLQEECFHDKRIVGRNYPGKDFHTMYVGQVIKCLSIS